MPPPIADELPSAGPRSRWRRWAVPGLAGGLVLVLGALSLVGLRAIGVWGPGHDPATEATGGPGTPTRPPSPFAGTPAEGFAEGAAGIVLPPAEPVGDFTSTEVATALDQVRQALVATRLDRTMLVDHDSAAFVGLLAAAQRPAMQEAFDSATFGTFATQVAAGAVLTPVPPRVEGTVSYRATTAERDLPVLEVVTRFVWAYAFELPPGDEPTRSNPPIVVVRDELEWQVLQADAFLEPSRGLWLSDGSSGAWGVDCDAYRQGLIQPGSSADQALDAGAAFDPEQPLPPGDRC